MYKYKINYLDKVNSFSQLPILMGFIAFLLTIICIFFLFVQNFSTNFIRAASHEILIEVPQILANENELDQLNIVIEQTIALNPHIQQYTPLGENDVQDMLSHWMKNLDGIIQKTVDLPLFAIITFKQDEAEIGKMRLKEIFKDKFPDNNDKIIISDSAEGLGPLIDVLTFVEYFLSILVLMVVMMCVLIVRLHSRALVEANIHVVRILALNGALDKFIVGKFTRAVFLKICVFCLFGAMFSMGILASVGMIAQIYLQDIFPWLSFGGNIYYWYFTLAVIVAIMLVLLVRITIRHSIFRLLKDNF